MESTPLMIVLRILVFLLGLYVVTSTMSAAVKTLVLPRGISVRLVSITFSVMDVVFRFRARRAHGFAASDRVMALYAPVTLLLLPVVMLTFLLIGYMGLYWALDPRPVSEVFKLSGSSLLTLGYASVDTVPSKILEFSEAMIGLIMVALLIAYLPTMYSAFARRESKVALLETWAGSPFSTVEMIARANRMGRLDTMEDVWEGWEAWFAEVEESHTSLAPLTFFRSPRPQRSWVTAAGTVLDAAALVLSVVDIEPDPRASYCIRSGYIALRQIADFFEVEHDPNPRPDKPISIERAEFEEICDELGFSGVPLKDNRDLAWRDFSGWRVNYDTVLIRLGDLTMSPPAKWITDRRPVEEQAG